MAAATDYLVVMTNVLGLPYRSPAVTAKMAETLDRLSGGRVVLGLGVGGYDPEFAAFGLAERSPGEKVGALDEAIKIIRGLWQNPSFTFDGDHFHGLQARIEPKPDHRIPIWIGAYGPRALRVTATLADGWIPSIWRLGLQQATSCAPQSSPGSAKPGETPSGSPSPPTLSSASLLWFVALLLIFAPLATLLYRRRTTG